MNKSKLADVALDTGLDVLQYIALDGQMLTPPAFTDDIIATLKALRVMAKERSADKSLPDHARGLWRWAGVASEIVLDEIQEGDESIANFAFMAGFYCARAQLVPREANAMAGTKSQLAARKPRKPRPNSVRDELARIVGWHGKSNGQLIVSLAPKFPEMDPGSILRQIRRLRAKKGGQ